MSNRKDGYISFRVCTAQFLKLSKVVTLKLKFCESLKMSTKSLVLFIQYYVFFGMCYILILGIYYFQYTY